MVTDHRCRVHADHIDRHRGNTRDTHFPDRDAIAAGGPMPRSAMAMPGAGGDTQYPASPGCTSIARPAHYRPRSGASQRRAPTGVDTSLPAPLTKVSLQDSPVFGGPGVPPSAPVRAGSARQNAGVAVFGQEERSRRCAPPPQSGSSLARAGRSACSRLASTARPLNHRTSTGRRRLPCTGE